jgi:hypothetical protein
LEIACAIGCSPGAVAPKKNGQGGQMGFRTLLALAITLALAVPASAMEKQAPLPRMVMTWVPPYDITTSAVRLRGFYTDSGPRNALTHLGLQFWTPSATGGLRRVTRYGPITNARIQQFVDWGHANGIKVLLCVFNGEDGWDWNLAKNAFITNREKFITALVTQMQARGLDGIDVDLEGVGDFEADKAATSTSSRSSRDACTSGGR